MIFSSVEFLGFLALLLLALALTRREGARRNLLIGASYVFYAWWDWRACFLLLGVTLVGFGAGLGMARTPERPARRPWLWAGVEASSSRC